jgi:YQGE family putative transporter
VSPRLPDGDGAAPGAPEPGSGQARARGGGLGRLALVTGLWSFGVAISEPFLNAFLWSLGSGWTGIGLFQLAQHLGMVCTFPAGGWLAKRVDRRLPLRLAGLAVAGALLLTLRLSRAAPRHLLGIGFALGVGWGFYWLAQFVFSFDLTAGAWRDRWQGVLGAFGNAADVLAPLAAAAIVAEAGRPAGFSLLFGAAVALLAAALLATRGLPGGATPGRFRLLAAASRAAAGPGWPSVLLAQLALAVRDGAYLFAPSLLVFVLSGSVVDLGAYLAATEVASLAAYAAHARWGTPRLRLASLSAGCLASAAAGSLLALGLSLPLAWSFGLLSAALQPLLRVPVEAVTLDVIGRAADPAGLRVELTVVKEVAVNAARVLSVGAMTLVAARAGTPAVRWWLAGVSVSPWAAWWALRRLGA